MSSYPWLAEARSTAPLLLFPCYCLLLTYSFKKSLPEWFTLNLQDFKNHFQILKVVSVMNKTDIFMHCLYVTLEEETFLLFFFWWLLLTFVSFFTSEYKNTDKLSFGEYQQLSFFNCIFSFAIKTDSRFKDSRLVINRRCDWPKCERDL